MKRFRHTLILIGFFALGYLPIDVRATSELRADFNNDGFDDLAIGVPHEGIGDVTRAGAVNIIYGSAAIGLTSAGNQVFSQDTADIADGSEVDDQFGSSLAAGDFNGDGFDDLAVGVAGEAIGTINGAGGVNIIYGSAAGLTSVGNQFFSQNTTGILDSSELGDRFGSSVAAGDFNGDGFDDLAVGTPNETIRTIRSAGGVNIIYGSAAGLTSVGNQFFSQNSTGILNSSEAGDRFASSVTAGDFDGDGFDDLAVGVPNEAIGTIRSAGGVNVIYGSATVGLTAAGNQFFSQNTTGILNSSEAGDRFGSSVGAGDFDGDGFDDLAVGVPGEAIGTIRSAGGVNVIYGSATVGLRAVGDQFFSQNTTGILDSSELEDRFGSSVTAGDFDNDGFDDLAVGVPGEAIGTVNRAGGVNIIYGSATVGLTAAADQFFSQDTSEILDSSELEDHFGSSVASGDFDGDGFGDLAVGVPDEAIGTVNAAGGLNAIYGSATVGLTAAGNQFFSQDTPGIEDSSEDGDGFGRF